MRRKPLYCPPGRCDCGLCLGEKRQRALWKLWTHARHEQRMEKIQHIMAQMDEWRLQLLRARARGMAVPHA